MPDLWLATNPGAVYLGQRRGWPTYRLPNGVYVIVTSVERNLANEASFEAALALTPCREIHLRGFNGPTAEEMLTAFNEYIRSKPWLESSVSDAVATSTP